MGRSGAETREHLLDAAERLFAARGIDGVTVREITAAAGVGNNSAVAYHFRSKLGLLAAVLERFLPGIDAARDVLLDRIDPGAAGARRALAEAMVLPLATLLETASGVRYLRIQAALVGYADRRALPAELRRPWSRPSMARLERLTAECFPGVAGATDEHVRILVMALVFHGLADYARSHPRPRRADRDAFVRTLVGAVVALLESIA